jgi:hypothetical protein
VPTLAAGKSETGLQRGVVCHGQLAGNSIVKFWMQVSGCSLRPALRPYAEMYISSDSDIRDLRFAICLPHSSRWELGIDRLLCGDYFIKADTVSARRTHLDWAEAFS